MYKPTFLFAGASLFALGYAVFGTASPGLSTAEFGSAGVSVVTLNLAKETSTQRMLSEIQATPAVRDADILLLQEVKQDPRSSEPAVARLAQSLGFHMAWSPAPNGADDQGLALLSRYPLTGVRVHALKAYDLRFHSRSRFALSATAALPRGRLRVYNAHLDTRLNTEDRLAQLEPILRDSAGFSGPRIIGGDFNSNAFYWLGRLLPLPAPGVQTRGIRAYMTRHGYDAGSSTGSGTYDYLDMRLDWVWVRGLHVREVRVYPLDFSDHHALWTRVEF